MAVISEEYQKLVLDDLKTYVGLYKQVNASLWERMVVKKTVLEKLHPNPDDEFSMPDIGPNYDIIRQYEAQFRHAQKFLSPPIEEPFQVEKMSTGGYLILNGHHRWMAANKVKLKTVPIHIVNVVSNEDIMHTIDESQRNMCVSFDLDEILLTDNVIYPADKKLLFPLNKIFKKTLRKNVPALITTLQHKGFDVWVYTGSYYSKQYIEYLFSLYHIKPDGIINGLNGKRSNRNIKELFAQKYKYSLHIDNDNVLLVNLITKDYESYDILSNPETWAADVNAIIKDIDLK